MKYADIKLNDIANGPGVRVSLFVQGCPHHCRNCFNPETWDFYGGTEFDDVAMNLIINQAKQPHIEGLSILGGEPFAQTPSELFNILLKFKQDVNKSVWIWSGYTFEEIMGMSPESGILLLTDVLVDGKFDESKKDLRLKFRGSSNQRIINVPKTLADIRYSRSLTDAIALWKDDNK